MTTQAIERRAHLAPIEDGTTYPLSIFMARVGMTRSSMREARIKGLPVFKVGKRVFVRGCDWNSYLTDHAEQV